MTLNQIANEVERLGYEYAESLLDDCDNVKSFFERFGVPFNETVLDYVNVDDIVNWVGADGDAFPEQVWSWAGCEEWIERDGIIKWIDEDGNEEDGTGDLFVDDWTAGIKRYVEEHFYTHATVGSENPPTSTGATTRNNIKVLQDEDTELRVGIAQASAKVKKNPSFKFERARFHVDTGPESLFERVRFIMRGVHSVKVDGPHFTMRVRERRIPSEVVEMVASFNASDWSVVSAEVRLDKGKFVASSWGREYNGRYYVVIIGLGDIAETIYDTDLPCPKFRPGRLKNFLENRSPFYDFVEKVNQELMYAEPEGKCQQPIS